MATDQVVAQLQQQNEILLQRLLALESSVAAGVPVSGSPRVAPERSVIDTKLMQKPSPYSGDRQAWADWAFTFRAYVGAVSARMKLLMDAAQTSSVTLAPLTNTEDRQLDEQLYFIIVMLVRDVALRKVKAAPEG